MLNRLAGAQASLHLQVLIGCEGQAGQVQACAGMLPKGRLVGGAGQKLLAWWEVFSSQCSLQVSMASLARQCVINNVWQTAGVISSARELLLCLAQHPVPSNLSYYAYYA